MSPCLRQCDLLRGKPRLIRAVRSFLGWLTILHLGPNREVYPFFDFAATDVYNYERTALSSLSKLTLSRCLPHLTRFSQ